MIITSILIYKIYNVIQWRILDFQKEGNFYSTKFFENENEENWAKREGGHASKIYLYRSASVMPRLSQQRQWF